MSCLDDVIDLFARSYADQVDEHTTVNFDLEIDGDDADYYMSMYFKKFEIDYSDFEFSKYFNDELGLKWIYLRIFKPSMLTDRQPLTLGHLSEVAKAKAWFDPNQ